MILSNKFIPASNSAIVVISVKARYSMYKTLAVSASFGVIFPKVGPGTSACIRFVASLFCFGKIARVKTRIPIPPIKWDKDLQNIIE